MNDRLAHRARLESIVRLTHEALGDCDKFAEHLIAAKIEDAYQTATNRLWEFDQEQPEDQ